MTQLRSDPLAFLGDELADLRDKHLYRPLRVMSIASRRRTVPDCSSSRFGG